MSKNYVTFFSSILVAALMLVGCQKDTMETKEATESNAAVNSASRPQENSCRMTVSDWPNVAKFEFRYNAKGLADEWIIDYGFGTPLHTNEMAYDNNGRLIQSNEFYFGFNYVYHFYYTGKLISRLTRTNVDNPADVSDVQLTYNIKGQNIRQDDDANDLHVLMTYDNIGNCTRTDMYIGDELVFSDIYTFRIPARNPRAAVPGVDIGFPFYGTFLFHDKWHFSSNRTEIYENGTMFLLNDYDPAQTIIKTGNHNYPISATYYDRVTAAPITIFYDYENCNGNGSNAKPGNPQSNSNPGINSVVRRTKPLLLRGTQKSMREQIKRMKKQLEK